MNETAWQMIDMIAHESDSMADERDSMEMKIAIDFGEEGYNMEEGMSTEQHISSKRLFEDREC